MSLQTLTDYYSALLAYQFRGLPNATRQIALYASQLLAETLPPQVLNAFNLDTAVGAQLDVIGKYVGVPRNVGIVQSRPYFGFWAYSLPYPLTDNSSYQGTWNPVANSPALSPPYPSPGWWVISTSGASTSPIAETWQAGDVAVAASAVVLAKETTGNPNGNGFTSYSSPAVNANSFWYSYSYATGQNSDLTDDQYRTVLKLKIAQNSSDMTLASIVNYLVEFFPGQIFVTDNKDMTLSYVVLSTVPLSQELLAIYLPRPMGVGITVTIVYPSPGGGDTITTESGDALTTESGDVLLTEGS